MYEDMMKMAQDSMKPMMKMVESNTAFAVKMMQSQSASVSSLMQDNLAHLQALTATKDMNAALEMQQKYVDSLNEKMANVAKENSAVVEAAISEAGKIFEGSFAEVQAQAKKTVEKLEKEMSKVAKKAA